MTTPTSHRFSFAAFFSFAVVTFVFGVFVGRFFFAATPVRTNGAALPATHQSVLAIGTATLATLTTATQGTESTIASTTTLTDITEAPTLAAGTLLMPPYTATTIPTTLLVTYTA